MARRRYEPTYKGSRTEPCQWSELLEIFKALFGDDIEFLPNFPTSPGHTNAIWRDRDLQIVEADTFEELHTAYEAFETSTVQVSSIGREPFKELDFFFIPARNEALVQGRTENEEDARRAVEIVRMRFPDAIPFGDLDTRFLASVRTRYDDLRTGANPQRRGQLFDQLICDLLRGHGCTAERGYTADGEQTDVFVFQPFHLLVECKWEAAPTEPRDIMILQAKLQERHAAVMGLFVSVAGYTDNALRQAESTRDRVLLCANQADVEQWLEGRLWFRRWWERKVDRLVQRYDLK